MASDRDLKNAREDCDRVNAKLREALAALDAERAETERLRALLAAPAQPVRERPPNERQGSTKKFRLGGSKGYVTVNTYPDGRPCEVFVTVDKAGSTVRGFADAWAIAVSMLLQVGVPAAQVAEKFRGARFEPEGSTSEGEPIAFASSVPDYVSRVLLVKYMPKPEVTEPEVATPDEGHDGRKGKV